MIEASPSIGLDIVRKRKFELLSQRLKVREHDRFLFSAYPPYPAIPTPEAMTVLRSERRFPNTGHAHEGDNAPLLKGPIQAFQRLKPAGKIWVRSIRGFKYFR